MPEPTARAVSLRAACTGAALVTAMSVVSPWAVLVVKGSQLTTNAVPAMAVVLFFLMTAVVVPLARLLGGRFGYTRGELIVVYAMMLTGSVVVTNGFTGSFLSVVTGARYYAARENDWKETILPNIHPWLAPKDGQAVRFLYEGLPAGASIPWGAWAVPLLTWLSFLMVFYWVVLCLGTILRTQWVDNERLVFPLTQLPLAMMGRVDEQGRGFGPIFGRYLFWLGLAVPLLWHSWNSLANYTDLVQKASLAGSIELLPGVGVPYRLHFPALGLGFLMPVNVSLSVWVFYLLGVAQKALLTRIGYDIGSGSNDIWTPGSYPTAMMHEQAGGMIVLVGFVLWSGRRYFADFLRLARRGSRGSSNEVLSPRTAVLGLAAGLACMVAWLTVTGLSATIAVLLVAGALVVYIGLGRIVCESGLPGCQSPMAPQTFIMRGFHPDGLGLRNMTGLGLSTVWMGETATNMMNAVMHSLRLTSSERGSFRGLPLAIAAAVVVGLAGSIWVTMSLAYSHGGINLHNWYYIGAARWPYDYLTSVVLNPEGSFAPRLAFTAGGGGFVALLLMLRQRFVWWPLTPIAFPVSATYLINFHWFAILLAWLLKGLVLRYGGIRAYRGAVPLFLGLILGEFAAATLWVLVDGAHGVEGNMLFNF